MRSASVPSDRSPAPPPAVPEGPADARVTPMMAQYIEIKAANPDCLLFYRMGDFYELFFDDAEVASRALGIVLTKRGKHEGRDIPMCGVPIDRSDDYLHKLIALGHRVAVCEQTEPPAEARKRGAKSVVRRAVVRLVTPGTLTEERLLEPARPNCLAALARRRRSETQWVYGVAALDISTGRFVVSEAGESGLAAELARLDPNEIVVPDTIREDPALAPLWADTRAAITAVPRDGLDPGAAERRLLAFYGVATLDAFGAFTGVEVAAAGAALAYVERTQFGSRPNLNPPEKAGSDGLAMDPATRVNLELLRGQGGGRDGSLLAAVDRTVTAAGARLLAMRLAGPLTDLAGIARRLDAVGFLAEERDLRGDLREALRQAPDIARAAARLALGRGGPRDLAQMRDGLAAAARIAARLGRAGDLPAEIADAAAALARPDPALAETLAAALADDLPLVRRDGGFLRAGFDPALDELRELAGDSRRVIAALQARYAAETGCRTLRIKHNNVIGYYVEVPQSFGETLVAPPWRDVFSHRQTMAGAMRFSTVEVADLESRIASASERALGIELERFDALADRVGREGPAIAAAADALAAIDVASALATLAADGNWVRPHMEEGTAFAVVGGRHPVVEAALRRAGQPFIGNDCDLSTEERGGRILLVTGPNMGGKSTFLRQNALLIVLAQAGSFVPAAAARIGIVDRLFSRVGAADDLARGRSTFMVEMVETAAILNGATARSFVILDEIGRGTATFDGLSIAWAAIEHLHDASRCRALFATHYHELTALADRLPRLANATLRVTEWDGEVVFLHEVVPGAADRSYGLQVAKLAGLPEPVVRRARTILTELERSDRERPKAALLDDLPLFAAAKPAEAPRPDPSADDLRDALEALDPDGLTPREALEALYRLKKAAARPHRQHP